MHGERAVAVLLDAAGRGQAVAPVDDCRIVGGAAVGAGVAEAGHDEIARARLLGRLEDGRAALVLQCGVRDLHHGVADPGERAAAGVGDIDGGGVPGGLLLGVGVAAVHGEGAAAVGLHGAGAAGAVAPVDDGAVVGGGAVAARVAEGGHDQVARAGLLRRLVDGCAALVLQSGVGDFHHGVADAGEGAAALVGDVHGDGVAGGLLLGVGVTAVHAERTVGVLLHRAGAGGAVAPVDDGAVVAGRAVGARVGKGGHDQVAGAGLLGGLERGGAAVVLQGGVRHLDHGRADVAQGAAADVGHIDRDGVAGAVFLGVGMAAMDGEGPIAVLLHAAGGGQPVAPVDDGAVVGGGPVAARVAEGGHDEVAGGGLLRRLVDGRTALVLQGRVGHLHHGLADAGQLAAALVGDIHGDGVAARLLLGVGVAADHGEGVAVGLHGAGAAGAVAPVDDGAVIARRAVAARIAEGGDDQVAGARLFRRLESGRSALVLQRRVGDLDDRFADGGQGTAALVGDIDGDAVAGGLLLGVGMAAVDRERAVGVHLHRAGAAGAVAPVDDGAVVGGGPVGPRVGERGHHEIAGARLLRRLVDGRAAVILQGRVSDLDHGRADVGQAAPALVGDVHQDAVTAGVLLGVGVAAVDGERAVAVLLDRAGTAGAVAPVDGGAVAGGGPVGARVRERGHDDVAGAGLLGGLVDGTRAPVDQLGVRYLDGGPADGGQGPAARVGDVHRHGVAGRVFFRVDVAAVDAERAAPVTLDGAGRGGAVAPVDDGAVVGGGAVGPRVGEGGHHHVAGAGLLGRQVDGRHALVLQRGIGDLDRCPADADEAAAALVGDVHRHDVAGGLLLGVGVAAVDAERAALVHLDRAGRRGAVAPVDDRAVVGRRAVRARVAEGGDHQVAGARLLGRLVDRRGAPISQRGVGDLDDGVADAGEGAAALVGDVHGNGVAGSLLLGVGVAAVHGEGAVAGLLHGAGGGQPVAPVDGRAIVGSGPVGARVSEGGDHHVAGARLLRRLVDGGAAPVLQRRVGHLDHRIADAGQAAAARIGEVHGDGVAGGLLLGVGVAAVDAEGAVAVLLHGAGGGQTVAPVDGRAVVGGGPVGPRVAEAGHDQVAGCRLLGCLVEDRAALIVQRRVSDLDDGVAHAGQAAAAAVGDIDGDRVAGGPLLGVGMAAVDAKRAAAVGLHGAGAAGAVAPVDDRAVIAGRAVGPRVAEGGHDQVPGAGLLRRLVDGGDALVGQGGVGDLDHGLADTGQAAAAAVGDVHGDGVARGLLLGVGVAAVHGKRAVGVHLDGAGAAGAVAPVDDGAVVGGGPVGPRVGERRHHEIAGAGLLGGLERDGGAVVGQGGIGDLDHALPDGGETAAARVGDVHRHDVAGAALFGVGVAAVDAEGAVAVLLDAAGGGQTVAPVDGRAVVGGGPVGARVGEGGHDQVARARLLGRLVDGRSAAVLQGGVGHLQDGLADGGQPAAALVGDIHGDGVAARLLLGVGVAAVDRERAIAARHGAGAAAAVAPVDDGAVVGGGPVGPRVAEAGHDEVAGAGLLGRLVDRRAALVLQRRVGDLDDRAAHAAQGATAGVGDVHRHRVAGRLLLRVKVTAVDAERPVRVGDDRPGAAAAVAPVDGGAVIARGAVAAGVGEGGHGQVPGARLLGRLVRQGARADGQGGVLDLEGGVGRRHAAAARVVDGDDDGEAPLLGVGVAAAHAEAAVAVLAHGGRGERVTVAVAPVNGARVEGGLGVVARIGERGHDLAAGAGPLGGVERDRRGAGRQGRVLKDGDGQRAARGRPGEHVVQVGALAVGKAQVVELQQGRAGEGRLGEGVILPAGVGQPGAVGGQVGDQLAGPVAGAAPLDAQMVLRGPEARLGREGKAHGVRLPRHGRQALADVGGAVGVQLNELRALGRRAGHVVLDLDAEAASADQRPAGDGRGPRPGRLEDALRAERQGRLLEAAVDDDVVHHLGADRVRGRRGAPGTGRRVQVRGAEVEDAGGQVEDGVRGVVAPVDDHRVRVLRVGVGEGAGQGNAVALGDRRVDHEAGDDRRGVEDDAGLQQLQAEDGPVLLPGPARPRAAGR